MDRAQWGTLLSARVKAHLPVVPEPGRSRLKRLLREPERVPGAVMRRLVPSHPRLGRPWIRLADGSITFREAGFVEADSPSSLLARHNFETICIRRLLRGKVITRSLEVGCGYGRLTPTLADLASEHIAVDVSPEVIGRAQQTYPEYDFRAASVTDLPFLDGYFDLVTTWTVLQHVPPDRVAAACSEVRRVLAVGGTLLLCEETCYADQPVSRRASTWDRAPHEYQQLLAPLELVYCSDIEEISRLPGMTSPGTVMVFGRPG